MGVGVQPFPVLGASAAGRASFDASDLPGSTSLHQQQTRASRAHTDTHSALQTGAGDDDQDESRHSTPKRSLAERTKSALKNIRLTSNYFSLYSVCDRTDILLLVVGIVAAIGSGVPLPLIGILFGQLIDGFNSAGCGTGGQPTDISAFLSSVNDKVSKIAIIAAVNFFLIWTYTTCWSNLGERLVRKMRQRYLRAVLRQDMAFFDTLKPGEVGTRLSADLLTIQNGTSEKMGILISSVSYFVTSYIVAFIKLPKLAAQLVLLLPAFAIIAPYLQTFSAASGAGQALRETIAKKSEIDGTDLDKGYTPGAGEVKDIALELKDVEFTYPARPDEKALRGLSISVPAGHRVALVGLSGSGKSTVASLLQRFYDPTAGSITLNGTDLSDYNVRWLRSQIGVVGQEPVLFDSSILQSIAHGLLASPSHVHLHSTLLLLSQVGQEHTSTSVEDLLTTTQQLSDLEEIRSLCEQAAKLAGAHTFITKLPHGYDTQVGEAGGKLSGGQKQRISIARAIVKQPKLLILDEATAALDSRSEEVVAKALDGISEGVTTVAIAHRLATVREYDEIVVMGDGKVLERGTHKDLLKRRGVYYNLAVAQDTGASQHDGKAEDGEDGEEEIVGEESVAEEKVEVTETKKSQRRRMDDVVEGDESESADTPVDSDAPSGNSTLDSSDALPDSSKPIASSPSTSQDLSSSNPTPTDSVEVALRYPPRVILSRVLSLLRLEWPYILLGLFTSAIMGGSYSGEAVLFGHVIEALNPQCHSPSSVKSSGREFGLYFFILALIQLVAYSINGLVWGLVAERLLFRLRRVSFNTMLDQRLAWYDSRDQNPASMIASLSNDANNLGGVTGTVIGTIFCIFINLIAGISVSLAIAWRIAIPSR
ncbi:hypothetical protein NDA16_004162 [Ustilago loliicola]|nr:hypothetical protein NDA16_004162 [Ustilago loliicola]